MKLFNVPHQETIVSSLESRVHVSPDEPDTFNQDTKALDNHVTAYQSLSVVCDQVSAESYSFIDKNNYVLYNEYIKVITSSLGVKNPPVVSQEAIQILPTVALNHHLSLEGFIGDMWEKIKALFGKIYDAVKKFFTNIFTRMGRLKTKLQNLEKVLSTNEKTLQKVTLENVPGGLASKYPVSGMITLEVIETTYASVASLGEVLTSVNKIATSLAKKEVLDKAFVAKIKSLRATKASVSQEIEDNKASKDGLLKSVTNLGSKNRAINKDNKKLKEIGKEIDKEEKVEVKSATDIGESNGDLDIDDAGFNAAKKEFADMLAQIETKFSSMVNKPLISGKVIKSIKISEDSGVDVEIDTDKETPDSVSLGDNASLLSLVKLSIKTIADVEAATKNYSEVNDTIMKSLDTVDKLIKDIDAANIQELGKYKTVLTKKIRERLNLMKNFFNNYNKVNKELMTMVIDATEGNVEYCVQSLKYFG